MTRPFSLLSVAAVGAFLMLGSGCTVVVHSGAPQTAADGHCYSCAAGSCYAPSARVVTVRNEPAAQAPRSVEPNQARHSPGERRAAAPRPVRPEARPNPAPQTAPTPPPAEPTGRTGIVSTGNERRPATRKSPPPRDPVARKTPEPRKTPQPANRRPTDERVRKADVDSPPETAKKRLETDKSKLAQR